MDYFDYSESHEDFFDQGAGSWELDVEEFLEQSQQQERQKLQQELQRIGRQLDRREGLHEETVSELESKVEWYSDRLEQLRNQFSGKHGEREKLKDRIQAFYTELRREKRNNWRDRQELEQERREILRELTDVKMDDLLSDLF